MVDHSSVSSEDGGVYDVQGMWSAISDSILFFAVFLVSQRWLALFTVSAHSLDRNGSRA